MTEIIQERVATGKRKLAVLDLFSGIGGFSLGLERTQGFLTVAFCEIDPFARRVLAKHWPGVPCYEDVRTLTAQRLAANGLAGVDVICGGFPCQDISKAGAGAGLVGERSGMWFEYHRIIDELRPKWVLIENVSALRSRGLDVVLKGLSEIGYDAEWHCIPAKYVGASHIRDRIWIVAYPVCTRVEGPFESPRLSIIRPERRSSEEIVQPWPEIGSSRPGDGGWIAPALRRTDDGISDIVDRLRAIGNAVVPDIPEMIGRAILAAA